LERRLDRGLSERQVAGGLGHEEQAHPVGELPEVVGRRATVPQRGQDVLHERMPDDVHVHGWRGRETRADDTRLGRWEEHGIGSGPVRSTCPGHSTILFARVPGEIGSTWVLRYHDHPGMRDLTEGSVTGHLVELSGFIAISMLFQTLYFLAGLYWVGRLG